MVVHADKFMSIAHAMQMSVRLMTQSSYLQQDMLGSQMIDGNTISELGQNVGGPGKHGFDSYFATRRAQAASMTTQVSFLISALAYFVIYQTWELRSYIHCVSL